MSDITEMRMRSQARGCAVRFIGPNRLRGRLRHHGRGDEQSCGERNRQGDAAGHAWLRWDARYPLGSERADRVLVSHNAGKFLRRMPGRPRRLLKPAESETNPQKSDASSLRHAEKPRRQRGAVDQDRSGIMYYGEL